MIHAHRWARLLQLIVASAFTGVALFLLVVGTSGQALPHEVQTVVNTEQIARLRADQQASVVEMKGLEAKIQSLTYEVTQIKAVVVTFGVVLTLLQAFVTITGRKIKTTGGGGD